MKALAILKYEWIYFKRSPFKIVAIILFILASVYGLNNASQLYHTQNSEIKRIKSDAETSISEVIAYYDNNEKGPKDRAWVDVTKPFWAIWYTNLYHFKTPSPLMVYGVGQAEQFGYYKHVTFTSSPYDPDMAEEIANPERLQTGHLDFSFAILYLLPLLLMICLYNVKGTEVDSGIMPLITVQASNISLWLWTRISFYCILLIILITALIIFGAILTEVFSNDIDGFISFYGWVILYLIIWTLFFGVIIQFGSFSINNTLKMVGVWIVLAFIIPGAVHQWISTKYPANLMTDLIDAKRDDRQDLYNLPDSVFQQKLNEKFPKIVKSVIYKDSTKRTVAMNESGFALTNELTKSKIKPIEDSYIEKNKAISQLYWINPVTLFQNKFNRITKTHFIDFQKYRDEIQHLIDYQIELMVIDIWNGKEVDKKTYLNYIKQLNDTIK